MDRGVGPSARCSAISLGLREEMFATAPHARGYLLLEQPGRWGARAVEQSELLPELASELTARTSAAGLRLLLIQRPGHGDPRLRNAFLCSTDAASPWLEARLLLDPAELLDTPLHRGFGEPVEQPLYLVCTNGRRDACCALYGRQAAGELHGPLEGRIWECSHLGGHRFAANVVALPEGHYFGRLRAATARRLVAELEEGRLDLDHYRGRSALTPPQQAADYLVRRATGSTATTALTPLGADALDEADWVVSLLDANGATLRVRVRGVPLEPPRRMSCGAEELEQPVAWELLGID